MMTYSHRSLLSALAPLVLAAGPAVGKTGYVAVTKDLTLNTTPTGTGSEFWIDTTNKTQDDGSLSIRISDDGCKEGQMIADTIRLTFAGDATRVNRVRSAVSLESKLLESIEGASPDHLKN